MKKCLQSLFILSLFVVVANSAQSQYNYWNGAAASFDGIKDSTGSNSISIGSAAKTASGVWFMDSVTGVYGWYLKNYYQAGSTGLCAGQTKDIRMPKTGTAPGYGCLATPYLAFGVNTVTYIEGRGRKTAIYYTTADTTVSTYTSAGNIPSNWIFADSTSNTKCAARVVTINNAAVRRIIFTNALSSGDQDVDSITITSKNVITPVRFGGISAAEANGMVKLNWNIETELNTNSYAIERAIDGDNYVAVGTIGANKQKSYTWIDKAANAGANYYRIKAIDNNGTYMYSNAVKIVLGKNKNAELSVYPNPVANSKINLQLTGITSGEYKLNFYSINGTLVYTTSVSSQGSSLAKSIDLPNLIKTGAYTLEVTNGSFRTVKTILIN